MNEASFVLQNRRRAIEDRIIASFHAVNFKVRRHRYLENDDFWDYIFSWYELVKFYEDTEDTAIGQNMLQLYTECVELFKTAVDDKRIHERRRDRAHMAIYQMNYYLQWMMTHIKRNGQDIDNAAGQINWK